MSSARTLRRVLGLLALITGVTGAARGAVSVTGQLTLLERPDAQRKDIATTILYLESLNPRAETSQDAASDEAIIAMRGRQFLPHAVVIRAGGTVKFPNQDPFSHNVFSNADPVNFDLGLYRRGETRGTTFAEHGIYPIYCNIHARMVSYVIAVPGRHVAFATDDGRFAFDGVAPGRYRLHVWHERATHLTQLIDVASSGATLQLSLDARGYVPGSHLNKFGMPYSSTRSDRY